MSEWAKYREKDKEKMPGYGRKPDRHDSRDLILKMPPHLEMGMPRAVNLYTVPGCPNPITLPMYDQGNEGSCTANAGVKYRRWNYQRFSLTPEKDHDLSRQFLYWEERALPWNNSTNEDSGASMRDICYVLAHTGVCPESDYPYSQDFRTIPSGQAVQDAADRKIGAYHRLADFLSVKLCMGTGPVGYPVLIGFPVYESFEKIGRDGIMPMPEASEQLLGGHAVFAWGYDDDRYPGGVICIDNSWGDQWGDSGRFYMPYAFLQQYWNDCDLWMMHLGKPWVTA